MLLPLDVVWLGSWSHGKSQAKKFTAAMAIPTPKRTPASTRLEPPSPKAKVRPATTMATKERPRAIVLVKACCSTLTAFSHGELPCAKTAAANSSPAPAAVTCRINRLNRAAFLQSGFILDISISWRLCMRVRFGEFSPELLPLKTRRAWQGRTDSLL